MKQKYFNIRKLRDKLDLTQRDVADVLNIPQSSISAMEIGKTKVPDKYIVLLEKEYNIKRENFMDEDDRIYTYARNVKGTQMGIMENSSFEYEDGKISNEVQNVLIGLTDKAEERISRLEAKNDELHNKLDKVTEENTRLKILLAKNGINFEP